MIYKSCVKCKNKEMTDDPKNCHCKKCHEEWLGKLFNSGSMRKIADQIVFELKKIN